MILSLVILSVLCLLLFISCFFLIISVRENVTLAEVYKNDYENYMEKYDHLCSQLSKHGFKVIFSRRSSCYIQLEKEDD